MGLQLLYMFYSFSAWIEIWTSIVGARTEADKIYGHEWLGDLNETLLINGDLLQHCAHTD